MSISEQLRAALDKSIYDFKRFLGDSPQWPVEKMYRDGEAWLAHWKRLGCSDAEARVAVRATARPRFATGGVVSAAAALPFTLSREQAERAARFQLRVQRRDPRVEELLRRFWEVRRDAWVMSCGGVVVTRAADNRVAALVDGIRVENFSNEEFERLFAHI